MKAYRPILRFPYQRQAMRLALFALLALQLLGIAAHGHQARMLADPGQSRIALCTPSGIEYIDARLLHGKSPAEEHGSRLDGGLHCALCALATLDPLPLTGSKAGAALADFGLQRPLLDHGQPATAPLALRPPPRAPPLTA